MGYHDLVSRSMVVLNDSRNGYDSDARAYLTERFTQSGATVEFMPLTRILPLAASSIRHTSFRRRAGCGCSRSPPCLRISTCRTPTGRADGHGFLSGAMRCRRDLR